MPRLLCSLCALALLVRRVLVRYAAVARVCLVLGIRIGATHLAVRGRSGVAQEALWELSHRVNARYVFEAVSALGGFWVH